MNRSSLNKKILHILERGKKLDFLQITALTVIYTAAISTYTGYSNIEVGLLFTGVLTLSVIVLLSKYYGSGAGLIYLFSILNSIQALWTIFIVLIMLSVYQIISLNSRILSLSISTILVHLGDAITTYVGLSRGFNEMNPLVDLIVLNLGAWFIFPIKLTVIPLIFLAHRILTKKYFIYFIKAAYIIGLYLTVSNLLVIL